MVIIDNHYLPEMLRWMFQCKQCGYWYHADDRGPFNLGCQRCYWGISVDRSKVITRKMFVREMVKLAEQLAVSQRI